MFILFNNSIHDSIVVSGLKGKLNDFYDRLKVIEEKSGKFDALFCVGKFFESGNELMEYSSGRKKSILFIFASNIYTY